MIISKSLEEAAGVLSRGGAIAYPTDTVFGLGVNGLDEQAIRLLFRIKHRPKDKPVPLCVKGIEQAEQLAFIDKKQKKFLEKVWPGPVTVVLFKRKIVPEIITAGRQTVALRQHNSKISWILSGEFPITGTSANISGEASPTSVGEVMSAFYKRHPQPDLILDMPVQGKSQPSTIVDLTNSDRPRILRIGMTTKNQLMKFLRV